MLFTKYGLPIEIVSDRGTHFINEVVQYLLEEFMVLHKKSAPITRKQMDRLRAQTKSFMPIKIVENSRMDWELKLYSILWAYRVAYKTVLGTDMPFNMVYGLDAILPLEFFIPTL